MSKRAAIRIISTDKLHPPLKKLDKTFCSLKLLIYQKHNALLMTHLQPKSWISYFCYQIITEALFLYCVINVPQWYKQSSPDGFTWDPVLHTFVTLCWFYWPAHIVLIVLNLSRFCHLDPGIYLTYIWTLGVLYVGISCKFLTPLAICLR